jgi:hypothetical protein
VFVRLSGSVDKNAWTDADTQLPTRLRATLQSSDGQWQTLSQRLRKQRFDPLVQHLKGVRRLIVLPSTALAGMPIEVIADGYTVCREHQLSDTVVIRWRQQLIEHAANIFAAQTPAQRDQQRIDDLERLIAQLTVELTAAKKVSSPWS